MRWLSGTTGARVPRLCALCRGDNPLSRADRGGRAWEAAGAPGPHSHFVLSPVTHCSTLPGLQPCTSLHLPAVSQSSAHPASDSAAEACCTHAVALAAHCVCVCVCVCVTHFLLGHQCWQMISCTACAGAASSAARRCSAQRQRCTHRPTSSWRCLTRRCPPCPAWQVRSHMPQPPPPLPRGHADGSRDQGQVSAAVHCTAWRNSLHHAA